MDRQVFLHPKESRCPSHSGDVGRQMPSLWMSPPSSFSSQLYILGVMLHATECPLVWLGSAILALSTPSSLCTPSLLAGGEV